MTDETRADAAQLATMSEDTIEPVTELSDQSQISDQPKPPLSPSASSTTSWEKPASTNSDTSILDLESLCTRLNEYNSRNEVAWALLRQQQRSVSSRQAHDVAAAARFRLRLDQTGPGGVQEPASPTAATKTEFPQKIQRSLSVESMSNMTGHRLARTKDSQSVLRKRKVTRPPPLRFDSLSVAPQEIQSAALPVRTSSKHAMRHFSAGSHEMPLQRRATITGIEPEAQRPNGQFPIRTASKGAKFTTAIHVAPAPAAAAPTRKSSSSSSAPTEDQLRREIELSLAESKDKTRADQRRSRRLAQMLSAEVRNELTRTATITATTRKASISAVEGQAATTPTTSSLPSVTPTSVAEQATEQATESAATIRTSTSATRPESITISRTPSPPALEHAPDASPTDTSVPSSKSSLRRKRSLFGWLQKKSEVDELIELYMDDEQLEEPKRRPSKARLGIFRSKSSGQATVGDET